MMSRNGIAGLFSVNRSVTNVGVESRQFRLPTMNSFPKLDQRVVRANSQPMRSEAAVMLGGQPGVLPEMTSDVAGLDAGYVVENVRRERVDARPWSRVGLAHLVGRIMGTGQSAPRP